MKYFLQKSWIRLIVTNVMIHGLVITISSGVVQSLTAYASAAENAASPATLSVYGEPTVEPHISGDVPVAEQPAVVRSRPLRCPTPANPYKRPQECWDEPFDMKEDTMTGDWHGVRRRLQDFGITPIMSYLTNIMGNTSGDSNSKLRYAGQLNASVTLDFEKMVRIPGLSLVATGSWGTGGGLSSFLGNQFNVMSADEGAGIWLAQAYLQEKLLNGDLTIAAGRMGQADIFAALPIFGNYLNAGINGNPGSLLINFPSFAEPTPGTEWGAQTTYNFSTHYQASVGIYNTNPNSAAATDRGVNLAFQQGNRGAMFLGQISYMHNQDPADKGMQGMYTLGALYDGSRFTSLSTGMTNTGNWSLYAMFQQMIYRPGGPGTQQGLTVWSEVTNTPKQYLNRMPLLLGAGLSYQGLISGRPDDIASVGWLYGESSRYLPNTTAEQVFEVNYQITLNNWLNITPDFQYIARPGGRTGSSAIPDAAVFGTQLLVTF